MTALDPSDSGHRALESLFAKVIGVIEAGAADRLTDVWTSAERTLLEHFEAEERTLLTDLLVARPREARVVLEEHAYLRRRLVQLRAMLPALSLEAARTFLDELRAHGRHEERALYTWAEARGPSSAEKTPA
jgi:hypothetical protein